jgi:hypothetical protein
VLALAERVPASAPIGMVSAASGAAGSPGSGAAAFWAV